MFNSKPSKTAPRPAAAAPARPPVAPPPAIAAEPPPVVRKPQPAPSVIGRDLVLEGGVSGDGELHIDGVVKGDVRVSRLTIGETGRIEGTVSAELVEARGKIVGSLTAKQVRLFATAHVDGDITHEQLAMETGASFQGRSLKFQRPVAPTPAPAVTAAVTAAPAPQPDVIRMSPAAN
jgi:cytoskeletal protein CcmA (bactofilin family)